ncbi:hypothetical protein QLX08_011586 [Tetragonisca angustula]|uniref:Uncharacterized protein n=1 Tax=Tetragonisca angustula TaxID=166442 RepID=A0AAW0Z845_9HYME
MISDYGAHIPGSSPLPKFNNQLLVQIFLNISLLVDLKNRRIIDNDYTKLHQIAQPTQGFEIPKHKIHHHIITSGRRSAERPRRLAPDKFKAAREEF